MPGQEQRKIPVHFYHVCESTITVEFTRRPNILHTNNNCKCTVLPSYFLPGSFCEESSPKNLLYTCEP